MSAYTAGVMVGMITMMAVAAVFAKCVNKMRKGPCKYDERQERLRGKGYKYGFLTLIVYNLVLGGLYLDAAPDWCDTMVQNVIGISLALTVFGVYCIWNDAYMSLNDSPATAYLIFLGIGGVNLAVGAMNLVRGVVMTDGRVNFRSTNLMLGGIFLLFAVVFWLKNRSRREEAE